MSTPSRPRGQAAPGAPVRRGRKAVGRTPARPDDPLVGKTVEVTAGSVGMGGVCIARLDGRVIFVRHTLPGERIIALITGGVVGAPLRADAVKIIEAAPGRVEPPCPHAGPGRCGGCDWQHASLETQRNLKASIVREQLARLAGLDVPVVVESPGPAKPDGEDDGLDWRTRVQFHVSAAGALGFHRHRSHDVETVEACPIASDGVEGLGAEAARWQGAATVEVIAAAGGDRALVVTPGKGDVVMPTLLGATSVLRGRRTGATEPQQGRPGVRERALGREWRVSGSGFWQVHPAAPELLSEAVLDALEPQGGDNALDLYCGVGLFAAALAGRVGDTGRVTAVESDLAAAADATFNLEDLSMVEVLTGRVEDVLLTSGLRRADIVALDPPRSGAGPDVTRWICSLRPRRIAYVACDPSSLARDLATAAEHGYHLVTLRAFDLFPMTQHVECLALLEPDEGLTA